MLSTGKTMIFRGPRDAQQDEATLETDADELETTEIYKWVISEACQSYEDITVKYKGSIGQKQKADRLFFVLKDTDKNTCFFALVRGDEEKWHKRNLTIVAFQYVKTPFNSLEEAENFLKLSKKDKGLTPGVLSAGSIKIGVSNEVLIRFVRSDKCQSVADIEREYKQLQEERDRATKIFEVYKFTDPSSIFTVYRASHAVDLELDKNLVIIAKAYTEGVRIETINDIEQCLKAENILVLAPKDRSFSQYTPGGSKLTL